MIVKVALIYHINFNHLSLSFDQRCEYLKNQLEEILDSIIVNSNVSICTEDLILLRVWNENAYNRLITHPKIKFLYTPHSHLINNLFPNQLIYNFFLGKEILSREIHKDKIQNILYPSEVEWPGSNIIRKIIPSYDGIILGENRIKIDGLAEKDLPNLFFIENNKKSIVAIISRKKLEYRNYLHKYYLDGASNKDLFKAVKKDWLNYSRNSILPARIDLEVVPFNTATKNGVRLKQPTNKMHQYQQYLCSRGVEFVFLEELINAKKTDSNKINSKEIKHNTEEDHQWSHIELRQDVLELKKIVKSNKKNLIWLSLLCSDPYYTNLKHLVLYNYKDRNKVVIIHKDRKYRESETLLKMQWLRETNKGKYILSAIKDKNLKEYFLNFQRAIQYLNEVYGNLL